MPRCRSRGRGRQPLLRMRNRTMRRRSPDLCHLCCLLALAAGPPRRRFVIPVITDPSPIIDGNLPDWANKGATGRDHHAPNRSPTTATPGRARRT